MSKDKSFYITTTLPYVNAEPHIGFAMELIHADIVARWKKLQGYEVFFNTGTDEHGQKIWQKAMEARKSPQEYVDEYAEHFKSLVPLLGISEDIKFIRTTDEKHKRAAQEMWIRCNAAGDIYKKNYTIKYCVGCELEKTDSEIANGHCIIHPHLELEVREEENYFFRFSKYSEKLLNLYENGPSFVIPDFRLNEMKALIGRGLEDFSISRLKEKMPWGVSVPGDSEHVMYVWFDALVNYISTLGWPEDSENYEKFWVHGDPTQFAGKDQVRQQAAMWQAMLVSAGLANTKHIVIHGFINYEGQKMSKSLGNVVSPQEIVDEYGTEALRYFVARELNQFEDTDISREKLKIAYNANLANGLGNLVARIMQLAQTHLQEAVEVNANQFPEEYLAFLNKFEIKQSVDYIWSQMKELDESIAKTEPFRVVKDDPEQGKILIKKLVGNLLYITKLLEPFMPDTSKTIQDMAKSNKKLTNIFPRKE